MLPVAEVNDFIAPASGLLGVVVGGLITAKVTRGLEQQRWQEQARQERLRESAEILGMVRVHLDELDRVGGAVRTVIRRGPVSASSAESLSNLFPRLPRDERRMMGRHFTRETWGDLTSAHFGVDLFLDSLPEYDPTTPHDSEDLKFLNKTDDAIVKGQAALMKLENGAQSEWNAANERTGEWAPPPTWRTRFSATAKLLVRLPRRAYSRARRS